MRRRDLFTIQAAVFAACLVLFTTPASGSGEALSQGVSSRVFHVITYDEHSRPLQQGQGMIVGSRDIAIVSAVTLEGAGSAMAFLMDGSTVPIMQVLTVDGVSGLTTVRLAKGISGFSTMPVEIGHPEAGGQILHSTLVRRSEQACVASVIIAVREVPDLEGIYFVETSRPLPRPGGGIFSSDGKMIGIVLLRSWDPSKGILASGEQLSPLVGRRSGEVSLENWASREEILWNDRVHARYMMGYLNLWQGRPRETLGYIEDHVRTLPAFSSSMTALLGEAYLTLDLLPEAIQAFKTAIGQGAASARVYRKLAWAYMEAGEFALAEGVCLKAILMDPECSSGFTLMAHLHNQQGRYRQAVYEARRALGRNPDCACSYLERGRGYVGLGKYRSAVRSFEVATALDPTYGEAFSRLGYARLRSGMVPGAIFALEEAVRLQPEMADAWSDLGEAYSRANLPEKAIHALRLAVCLDPSRGSSYCRLARELMNQGYYLDAVDIIREGLDRCERSQWLVYYLGKALLHEGRRDLARIQAERLCSENRMLADQLARLIDQGPEG